ncbi:MAG: DUF4102 domain-containing protein, partial [Gammaproteobacteria bacterium]|nr:DUF4102 domain-containing protein [Gammaproteobacteria bacterium]
MAGELNKLSDRKLKGLHGIPASKIEFYADGAGLSAKVTKAGGISWVFTYRLDGQKLHRLTLGRYPDMSLKEARSSRDKCRQWLASGKDPKHQLALTTRETLKPVTVQEAIEYWIREYAEENRANVERHKAELRKHIYPYIGKMALADCETRYWLDCFDRAKRETPVAAGYVFQMCKQALKYCRVRRYAVSNALDDLAIPDVGQKQAKRDRVHSEAELADICNAITSETFFLPYYNALLKTLLVFGARTNEVRLSETKEWDVKTWIWTVPKEHAKGGEKIVRPVPEAIRPFILDLIEQHKDTGFLLGEAKDSSAVSQWGRGIYKRLDHKEPWTLHDLRRTFSTTLNDMGV